MGFLPYQVSEVTSYVHLCVWCVDLLVLSFHILFISINLSIELIIINMRSKVINFINKMFYNIVKSIVMNCSS
jgi:hypothetical protein